MTASPVSARPAPAANAWAWPTWRDAPGLLALVGVISLAMLRCLVMFAPQIYWDAEPQAGQLALGYAQFGPLGAAVTNCLAVLVLALALWDAALHRRRVHRVLIGLWLVGAAFASIQGRIDAVSLSIGGSWIGGLALGLAAMHLAQRAEARRVMIAAIVAFILPLTCNAIYQGTVERVHTLQSYQENRPQFMEQRGWTDDSPQLRKFERRLDQFELIGRIGFSNVLGTVTLMLVLAGAGVTLSHLAAAKDKRQRVRAIIAGAVTALAATALALTFSKGAVAAGAIIVVAVAVAWGVSRATGWGAAWWRVVLFGTVALGIAAVLIRPHLLPVSVDGEKSLLFRSMYWRAAGEMIEDAPVLGVGPGRFQQKFLRSKPSDCPEEVSDPHNVFVAYISTLGLGGAAWSILLLGFLWHGARHAARAHLPDETEPPSVNLASTICASIPVAAVLIFGAQYAVQYRLYMALGVGFAVLCGLLWIVAAHLIHSGRRDADRARLILGLLLLIGSPVPMFMYLPDLAQWMIGAGGFVAIAMGLAGSRAISGRWVTLGLIAAAGGVMLHSQIEMGLTNTMSMPLLCVVLGLAAAGRSAAGGATDRRVRIPWEASIALAAAAVMVVMMLVPVARQQHQLRRATHAYLLDPLSEQGVADLTAAQQALPDARIAYWVARLRMDRLEVMFKRELISKAELLTGVDDIVAPLDRFVAIDVEPAAMHRTKADIHARAAILIEDPSHADAVIDALRQMLWHDPLGIEAHLYAADLAWKLGNRGDAGGWYIRALHLSDAAHLDPHSQLAGAAKQQAIDRSSSHAR